MLKRRPRVSSCEIREDVTWVARTPAGHDKSVYDSVQTKTALKRKWVTRIARKKASDRVMTTFMKKNQCWLLGIFTTSPSNSGETLIWHDRREVG